MGGTRDKILAADDLPREQVQTDEWAPSGVPFVFVRGLSAAERNKWDDLRTIVGRDGERRPNPKLTNATARFAALVMVDEDGTRLFTDADVERLADRSSVVLERIGVVGLRLSGMLDEEANPSTGDQAESPSSD